MIEAASSEEQKTAEYRTRKLESLSRQNELIEEENRKREEAEKAKKVSLVLAGEVKSERLVFVRKKVPIRGTFHLVRDPF